MNRREFLKLLMMTLASTSVSACTNALNLQPASPTAKNNPIGDIQPTPESIDDNVRWDVIIVGAGIAGLRAAQILQQNGRRVLLLEARNRTGGRVWTDDYNGLPLELGASWIHGTGGNPIAAIANQLSAALISTNYDDMQRFDASGEPLSTDLDRRVEELLERYVGLARKYAENQDRDLSLQTALESVLRTSPLSAQDLRLLNYAINTTFEHEYAGDASRLSAWYFDEQEEFDDDDVIFKHGYRMIIDFLAQNLEIRLNHAAQQVTYDNSGVTIKTAQGIWRAQAALMTVPLGVLQRGSITFEPPLPAAKQQALGRIAMGLLNKCYLVFPEVFWDDATLLGYVGDRKGEWAEWLNLDALLGAPILLGFNAGEYAHRLETQSDSQIVEMAMQTLRQIYGKSIPDPLHYRITRWGADPFSFGSYSFLAVGATPDDYDTLAQPMGKRLFFAGEHTQRDYPSTVHGAYLSGERAAHEILSLIQ